MHIQFEDDQSLFDVEAYRLQAGALLALLHQVEAERTRQVTACLLSKQFHSRGYVFVLYTRRLRCIRVHRRRRRRQMAARLTGL
jgi:hypothetical protein